MESAAVVVVKLEDGSNVLAGGATLTGPVAQQGGDGSDGSDPGTVASLPPPARLAKGSDSSGAYGGFAAHEATKLRSRDAQRKLRQRLKVSCVQHWQETCMSDIGKCVPAL